jgi:hypothetical protein
MNFCSFFYDFYVDYLFIIISSIGLILNLFCTIAFIYCKELKKETFRYFLLKSICDTIFFTRNTLNYLADNCGDHCILITSHILCYTRFSIYYFVGRAMLLASMIFSVIATFDQFRKVKNTFLFFDKIPFWSRITTIFLYSFVYYWYIFTGEEPCQTYLSFSNTTYFSFSKKSFRDTIYGVYLELIHSIIRDCISLILIVILNILTLIFVKESFARKRHLKRIIINTIDRSSSSSTSKNNLKEQKAEKNLTQLVVVTSIINFFGHILLFIFYFPLDILKKNSCLKDFANLMLYISLAINFFIYYAFNRHFSKYFTNAAIKFIQMISFGIIKLK